MRNDVNFDDFFFFLFFFLVNQEGSVWLFTAEKFDGSRPFTVVANYEGFSEGIYSGGNANRVKRY